MGGLPRNSDFNGASRVGLGAWPKSAKQGKRWTSGKAFLTPEVRALPNFKLRTMVTVTKVLFDDAKRVTGVSYMDEGRTTHTVKVAKEVILSAGAFRSPQLLMLS